MIGGVEVRAPGRTGEAGVAVVEDSPVRGHLPVAVATGSRCHADDRFVQRLPPHRPVEVGVAEGEETPVGCNEPVAIPVGGRLHADDGLVEGLTAHRSVEGGAAERVDATFGVDQPIAAIRAVDRHAHDRLGVREARPGRVRGERSTLEDDRPGCTRFEEAGVAEGTHGDGPGQAATAGRGVPKVEHVAVGLHFPIAPAVGCGGNANDRCGQRLTAERSVEWRIAEREDATVGGHFPVAPC